MFLTVLKVIAPLYILVIAGFVSGKFLTIRKEHLSEILIHVIAPFFFFHVMATMKIDPAMIILPTFFLVITVIASAGAWITASLFTDGRKRDLLASITAVGNTGYFGIPLAIMLFGNEMLGLYIFCMVPGSIFQLTIGNYLLARGDYDFKQSVIALVKIPAFIGMAVGLIWNVLGLTIPGIFDQFFSFFPGAYTIFGMMLIGLAVAEVNRTTFDFTFVAIAVFVRFIMWPLIGLSAILADIYLFHLLQPHQYLILLLASCVPLAADGVSYATHFRIHPGRTAVAVITTTALAFILTPLFYAWLSQMLAL